MKAVRASCLYGQEQEEQRGAQGFVADSPADRGDAGVRSLVCVCWHAFADVRSLVRGLFVELAADRKDAGRARGGGRSR